MFLFGEFHTDPQLGLIGNGAQAEVGVLRAGRLQFDQPKEQDSKRNVASQETKFSKLREAQSETS